MVLGMFASGAKPMNSASTYVCFVLSFRYAGGSGSKAICCNPVGPTVGVANFDWRGVGLVCERIRGCVATSCAGPVGCLRRTCRARRRAITCTVRRGARPGVHRSTDRVIDRLKATGTLGRRVIEAWSRGSRDNRIEGKPTTVPARDHSIVVGQRRPARSTCSTSAGIAVDCHRRVRRTAKLRCRWGWLKHCPRAVERLPSERKRASASSGMRR